MAATVLSLLESNDVRNFGFGLALQNGGFEVSAATVFHSHGPPSFNTEVDN
jgi:hypothetical protein